MCGQQKLGINSEALLKGFLKPSRSTTPRVSLAGVQQSTFPKSQEARQLRVRANLHHFETCRVSIYGLSNHDHGRLSVNIAGLVATKAQKREFRSHSMRAWDIGVTMTVKFACVKCGVVLQVPDSMSGTVGKCPSCGVTNSIPNPEYGAAPVQSPGVVTASSPHDPLSFLKSDANDRHSSWRTRVPRARRSRKVPRGTLILLASVVIVSLLGGAWWAFRGVGSASATGLAVAEIPATNAKQRQQVTAESSPRGAKFDDVLR